MSKYLVYIRKSTESEDRQVLSLESQSSELEAFLRKENIIDYEFLEGESKSAKQPGRPRFDQMIKRIEKGEADGIIAWHPDRLARNSIDGGKIIYLLDTGKLRDIRFPIFKFENSPQGKFMLNIFFGQSKYYVDNLSENVKRGNRTKLQKGWLPGLAPIGYKNDSETRTIVKDEERFPLVRRLWQLFLSGSYSVSEIHGIANEEWGLRTRKYNKIGDKKLSKSHIYRILTNPFYYGMIKRAGEVYQGSHEPMISAEQFNNAQKLLGRPNQPRLKHNDFTYTGLIRCGECGCMVTAEHRYNRYGSYYVYYHCTKRRVSAHCSQKYVRVEKLEKQIIKLLDSIKVSDNLRDWVISYLQETNNGEIQDRRAIYQSQQKEYNKCQARLDELTQMRFKHMLTDEEYLTWKEKIMSEQMRIKEKLVDTEHRAGRWFELSEKVFLFANQAKIWFEKGTEKQKREILQSLGSNFYLKDGLLSVQLEKPYLLIAEKPKNRPWSATVNDVMNFFIRLERDFHVPVLPLTYAFNSTLVA